MRPRRSVGHRVETHRGPHGNRGERNGGDCRRRASTAGRGTAWAPAIVSAILRLDLSLAVRPGPAAAAASRATAGHGLPGVPAVPAGRCTIVCPPDVRDLFPAPGDRRHRRHLSPHRRRRTGAGVGRRPGCPDWPRCFGSWIPPASAADLPPGFDPAQFNPTLMWTEYLNRLLGVTVGVRHPGGDRLGLAAPSARAAHLLADRRRRAAHRIPGLARRPRRRPRPRRVDRHRAHGGGAGHRRAAAGRGARVAAGARHAGAAAVAADAWAGGRRRSSSSRWCRSGSARRCVGRSTTPSPSCRATRPWPRSGRSTPPTASWRRSRHWQWSPCGRGSGPRHAADGALRRAVNLALACTGAQVAAGVLLTAGLPPAAQVLHLTLASLMLGALTATAFIAWRWTPGDDADRLSACSLIRCSSPSSASPWCSWRRRVRPPPSSCATRSTADDAPGCLQRRGRRPPTPPMQSGAGIGGAALLAAWPGALTAIRYAGARIPRLPRPARTLELVVRRRGAACPADDAAPRCPSSQRCRGAHRQPAEPGDSDVLSGGGADLHPSDLAARRLRRPGGCHVAMAFACHSSWVLGLHWMRRVFQKPAPRRALGLATAVALLWLAARYPGRSVTRTRPAAGPTRRPRRARAPGHAAGGRLLP